MHKYLNFNSSKDLEPYKSILLNDTEKDKLRKDINSLLKIRNAVIIAHYYTDPDIQQLAEETNGCVADSLEMAKFGSNHSAGTLMVAGVRFMGETAKILNPEKTVLMPTLLAECSLDLSCPKKEFSAFCNTYPDRTVVVYANTSAAVKARADWVVTSSIAVDVIDYLDNLGKKIIWGPDYNLGRYIQKKTGADMLFWHGTCIVHDEFKAQALINMKKIYPDAAIVAHPESPENILQLADIIGSTSQLIYAIQNLSNRRIIVATDKGIMYKMQQLYPRKIFLEAPTSGEGAICHSCAHCPWMSLNNLKSLANGLLNNNHQHEIYIEEIIRRKALISLNRMLTFLKKTKIS